VTESLNLFQQSQRNLIIKVLNECKGNLSEASKKFADCNLSWNKFIDSVQEIYERFRISANYKFHA